MSFAIDTSKLDMIRSDIGYSVLPKITNSYDIVWWTRKELPWDTVTSKKWIYSDLYALYYDIKGIENDCVKIQNLLYKAVDKMNRAEQRAIRFETLKNYVVEKKEQIEIEIKEFGEDLYNEYQEAKEWVSDSAEWLYETGAEVVETVSNWIEDLTWEDVKNFFKSTAATIVVAFQSLTKGLLLVLQALVDLVYIVGAVVGTVFTGISDGVNYLLTGESGGYTKALWDGTMGLVAEANSTISGWGNWLSENNPDWVNEYSVIEVGGTVDQIIQGLGYMLGIIGISLLTFGQATPVALACTAGTLGFAKGTAESWNDNKVVINTGNGDFEMSMTYEEVEKLNNGLEVQKEITQVDEFGKEITITITFRKNADGTYDAIVGNQVFKATIDETEAWQGLVDGAIDGSWEAFQYYVGGKIGTSVFGPITSKITNPFVQKLTVSGLRVMADSLTGAVEVPFQSLVAMTDTHIDDIEGNELSWKEAWDATGGWKAVGVQTAIAGLGSIGGEAFDFGKAAKNAKLNGKSYGEALDDIYIDDLINSKKKTSLFGGKKKNVDIIENVDNNIKNSYFNDPFDDNAIAMANRHTNKGLTQVFRFSDAENIPGLEDNFWKNIENPDKIIIDVNGRKMSFDDAISYKMNYDLNMKDVAAATESIMNQVDTNLEKLTLDNLKYTKSNPVEAAISRFESSAKRYIYKDTNMFEGLNERIMDNGLYHFTDKADLILDSGYIKATGEKLVGPLGYLGPAYGNAKTFFFEGIPEVGAFATNLDSIPLKTTAVKVVPNADVLNNPKLRVRNLDDGAITWDGRLDLNGSTTTKEYFCLVQENDELVYKKVSEEFFNNYENTSAGKQLSEFINRKSNVSAIKDDYLRGLSFKNTGAKISDSIGHTKGFERIKQTLANNEGSIDFGKFKKKNVDIELSELEELKNANLKSDPNLERFNNAKVFSSDLEVAMNYNDPKQYLYFRLEEIAKATGDPNLNNFLESFGKYRNIDKDYNALYSAVAPYLDSNDMANLSKMSLDPYNGKFTSGEQEELFIYSAATGPALAAYERGSSCKFVQKNGQKSQVYDGTDKVSIQNLINKYGRIPNNLDMIDIDKNVKIIDKIIKKAPPLKEDTILYRGVNSLFCDGKQLNLTDIKPGQIINDKATVSTSLLGNKAYTKNDIMLEILAPKGTKGAYIESFVRGYSQQEVLLGRNTRFKVLSMSGTDPLTNKTTIKVEIVPPDDFKFKLKNTGATISEKFKSLWKKRTPNDNFTNKLADNINSKVVNNITTELTDNYPNKIVDNITTELTDNYPNKIVDNITTELTDNYPNKIINNNVNNVIDKMNLRSAKASNLSRRYNDLFNKSKAGIEVDDFVDNLKRKGLLDKFDAAIHDIDELYSRPPGPNVIHHDVSHVERVMLFAMDMGDKFNLSKADMDLLIDATKYHDVGVYLKHEEHAIRSAAEALNNLRGKYSGEQLNKMAAIIECHELDDRYYVFNNLDNRPVFEPTFDKYNIPLSERQSVQKLVNILKDADAVDRTRFRNNLDTRCFRNKNEANELVKTSYEMQEIGGKIALDERIKNNPSQAEQIMNWRNRGIPDYVIEESYATYYRWPNPATPGIAFSSPDEMIISWMRGAGYQI